MGPCENKVGIYIINGITYNAHDMFQDGCKCRCFCNDGKGVPKQCRAPCGEVDRCYYNGLVYKVGREVPNCAVDHCNTCECKCTETGIRKACSRRYCPPPPSA